MRRVDLYGNNLLNCCQAHFLDILQLSNFQNDQLSDLFRLSIFALIRLWLLHFMLY